MLVHHAGYLSFDSFLAAECLCVAQDPLSHAFPRISRHTVAPTVTVAPTAATLPRTPPLPIAFRAADRLLLHRRLVPRRRPISTQRICFLQAPLRRAACLFSSLMSCF